MSSLQKTIEAHALQFATAIAQALRSASLGELTGIAGTSSPPPSTPKAPSVSSGASPAPRGGTGKKAGRLGRRSPADIERTLSNIVSVLMAHPEGLRAEQIKAALQLDTREMPRPIAEGLKVGTRKKSGNKRATIYTVGSSGTTKKRRTKKTR